MPTPLPHRYPPDQLAGALTAIYERAQTRLTNLAAGAIERGATGSARYFESQKLVVRAELRKLKRDTARLKGDLVRSAYLTGLGAIDRVLHRDRAFTGVHSAAMDVLAANIEQRLAYAEDFVGRQIEDVYRQAALAAVSQGIAGGLTPQQRARDVAFELRSRGVNGFVDRKGRRWRLDAYAAMVARTTTREAMSRGMANRLIDHGRHLVEVSKHRGACPICIPLQGRTYTLTDEGTPEYPKLEVLPPFHPNCRHVLLPASVTFEQMEAALNLGPSQISTEIVTV